MRISNNQFKNQKLFNGFDYENQAWVLNGVYVKCGHLINCNCYGTKNAGKKYKPKT